MASEEKEDVAGDSRRSPKPLPNYLKPTISSLHQSTCRRTQNHQGTPPGRHPPPKVFLRKSSASSLREIEKPSKTPPPAAGRPAAAPPLRKAISLPRVREQGNPARPASSAPPQSKLLRSKSSSPTTIEVPAAGPRRATPAARRPAVAKKEGKGNAKVEKQQELPAHEEQGGPAAAVTGEGQPGQIFQGEELSEERSVEVIKEAAAAAAEAEEEEEEEAGDLAEAGEDEDPQKGSTESNKLTGGG